MPKASQPRAKTHRHTVKLPELLERRVRQCMALDHQTIFNEFAVAALTRRCRQILAEHGQDPDAPPPGLDGDAASG